MQQTIFQFLYNILYSDTSPSSLYDMDKGYLNKHKIIKSYFIYNHKKIHVNTLNANNDTPLSYCMSYYMNAEDSKVIGLAIELMLILLDNGADANIINDHGYTVLDMVNILDYTSTDSGLNKKKLIFLEECGIISALKKAGAKIGINVPTYEQKFLRY